MSIWWKWSEAGIFCLQMGKSMISYTVRLGFFGMEKANDELRSRNRKQEGRSRSALEQSRNVSENKRDPGI